MLNTEKNGINSVKSRPFSGRNLSKKLILSLFVCIGILTLGSWSGGPYPDCRSDSLAIVRIVKPINDMFNVQPIIYVSKGLCKIDEVTVSDRRFVDGDLAVHNVLSNLLVTGFTIQSSTESFESGVQLNTYYLKKKAI